MAIDLEKILTISSTEYAIFSGVELEEYVAIGIHVKSEGGKVEDFSEKVPDEAEVVVSFQQTYGGGNERKLRNYIASGTALIPKKMISPLKEQ